MPTVTLASIQADVDKEYGDLEIVLADATYDEAGVETAPADVVALRNGIRLSKEARADLKVQQARYRALTADPDDVVAQRASVNAAQNRLDSAKSREGTTERVLAQLEARLAEETDKLTDLTDAHEAEDDDEGQAAELRAVIFEMIRAVAVSKTEADRLLETTKTESQPDGDLPYLMGIFGAYMNHGEVGEASPSES